MKDRLSNLLLVLLLFLPLLAVNRGWREVDAIVGRWRNQEQERLANQKLGEISANLDFSLHMAEQGARLSRGLTSLLREYPGRNPEGLPVGDLADNIFASPFPQHALWVFLRQSGKSGVQTWYNNEKNASRRPMEMIMQSLIDENSHEKSGDAEGKRSEKLLQKVFGHGCRISLIAGEQRNIATPVIYRQIPSFLLWDFAEIGDGRSIGFFLVVSRNQDIAAASMALAARKAGLGAEMAGGFLRIFKTAGPDQLFPPRIGSSRIFKDWRQQLGLADKNIEKWENEGFPWAQPLGRYLLYCRVMPLENHIAFLLLPADNDRGLPAWLSLLNLSVSSLLVLLLLRGSILGIWPFASISSRFAIVVLLAATLPASLYVTSATAYIFERLKADENHLEETLVTSLLDFDASKETLENDYLSLLADIRDDREIEEILAEGGVASGSEVFARARDLISRRSGRLSVSGFALYDLCGDYKIESTGKIKVSGFDVLARFYGLPYTLNLRKTLMREEPEFVLPPHRVDEKNLAAMQSFKRDSEGIDVELARYRGRVVRSDTGRGYLGCMNDFLAVNGKKRFVIMLAWLESEIDRAVISRSVEQLGLRAPEIKLAAFKRSDKGVEMVLRPDRAFSQTQLRACQRFADSAFSIKSGILKTTMAGMSVVAYASRHFDSTVLIGAIDHTRKDSDHSRRIILFLLLGGLALGMLAVSILGVWLRIVRPLQIIKSGFDAVERGRLQQLPVVERTDEIGLLNSEFNAMIRGLEERHRLASMLSEHAVNAVANATLAGRAPTEKFAGVVLVTDIRSFTSMCEEHPAVEITALLNDHVTEMATIIGSFGGKIYKFIGDAIEAVFADDFHFHQSPGMRATFASICMLRKLQEINNNRKKAGLFTYKIGIGLSAGEIVAGETGSRFSRRDYGMFGSAFKRAAEFESMTRNFAEWPIIADRHLVQAVEKIPLHWHEVSYADEFVYNMQPPADEAVENMLAASIRPKENQENRKDAVPDFEKESFAAAGLPESRFSMSLAFLAGVFCIIFPLIAWFVTERSGLETRRRHIERDARSFTANLKARIGTPEQQKIVFEQYVDTLCENLTSANVWSIHGVTSTSLAAAANEMQIKLQSSGLQPELFAVLHKPGGAEIASITPDWKLVSYSGKAQFESFILKFLRLLALRFYTGKVPDTEEFMKRVSLDLGINMRFWPFYNDAHARLADGNIDGNDCYFFWQPLLLRDPKLLHVANSDFRGRELRRVPSEEEVLQVGAVMCAFRKSNVHDNFFRFLVPLLEGEGLNFALRGGLEYTSAGFPVPAAASFNVGGEPLSLPGWYFSEIPIKNGSESSSLVLAIETLPEKNSPVWPGILIALALVIFWHRTLHGQTFVARSFPVQLWLGLFASAIVPVTCVYTVNEWYAVEQKDLRVNEERVRMISLIEQLERRQFMQETIEWEKIRCVAGSEKLINMARSLENPSKNELYDLEEYIRSQAAINHGYTGRTSFNEAIVFSSLGWNHSVMAGKGEKESTDFKLLINTSLETLLSSLGVEKKASGRVRSAGAAVKGEMTLDAGLEIFRTIFGVDAYFKLVHGLDLPIRLFYSTGSGCLRLMPFPGLLKPELIVYWLFFDSLNSTTRRIFKNAEVPFPVFAEAKLMYGALKYPKGGSWNPEIAQIARLAVAANGPLSSRRTVAGRECLVEARLGSHNETMLMIAVSPEDEIMTAIENGRRKFLVLLLLSIVAVVLLTLLVAADVSLPVRQLHAGVKMMASQQYDFRIASTRSDELGQMLHSFNGMARGLQERELMGQMVSRAARMVAGDEESLKKAESGMHLDVTVLYLSVPGFADLQKKLAPEELLAGVSAQVDVLCGIIINNDGEADKIIGEKILAYFYSPEGLKRSNAMAMHTLQIISDAAREGLLPFQVAAGVHCGSVIAGLLGISSKRDFTIIGDTVNTAARINAQAAEMPEQRYLVSTLAAEEFEDKNRLSPFGSVALKGKSETVDLLHARL